MLDAATAPRPDQLAEIDAGRARADNLQAHLHYICDHAAGCDGCGCDNEDVPTTGGGGTPTRGITDLTTLARLPGSIAARIAAAGNLAPPKLLVRVDLDTLLGRGDIPGELLTRLMGRSLRLTSTAARHVVDHAGAQVRAIVVDDGEVVGVGRQTRVAPGWLADAVHALHDCCTGPLCDRPALSADLDHAIEWNPDGPGPHGPGRSHGHLRHGSTDINNIGPLCAGTNRDRRATGWTPAQSRRGVRTWHHERSGLTVTSVPSTWRPPGHRARPPGTRGDPPGRARPPDARDEPDDDPCPF